MRILIVPGSNSLSHLIKALSIKKYLTAETSSNIEIAVSGQFTDFAKKNSLSCFKIPNIQETDFSNFPTSDWFKNSSVILNCIREERKIIKEYKPDLILGIFNFTIKISAQFEKVPFYSLSCGCMLSNPKTVFGFDEKEPLALVQKDYLNSFFKYLTKKMNAALNCLKVSEIEDVRECLEGAKTYLWDFPEFMPIPEKRNIKHIGPIPVLLDSDEGRCFEYKVDRKMALVSFGTCLYDSTIIARLASTLNKLGYKVIIPDSFNSGQALNLKNLDVTLINGIPLYKLLRYSDLIVTHGGQMTLFESISEKKPILVLPFQPEQDHNGLCLEKINCGARFFKSEPFNSQPNYYINRFNIISDCELERKIKEASESRAIKVKLEIFSQILRKYNSLETLKKEIF